MILLMHCFDYFCIVGNHDNNSPSNSTTDIDLKRCGAYEIVRLSKQKVVMNENPAYGEVGRSNL